jgi:hypothetical protein
MQYLTTAIAIFMVISTQLIADLFHDHEETTYIHDTRGTSLFVKVYIDNINLLNANDFLLTMTQEDEKGHFLAIPVRKKKEKDDEYDETYWICPICGWRNPASEHVCGNSDCPLYRRKPRDWRDSLAR